MATSVLSGYVVSDGNPLNYLEWGRTHTPTLVIVPAFGVVAYQWQIVAEKLAHRYRCIALNPRGHGDSGPVLQQNITCELFANDIHALAEGLGLSRFSLMSLGSGGRVAIPYAADHPERAQALVLIESGPAFPVHIAESMSRNLRATPEEFDSWEEAIAFADVHVVPSMMAPPTEERAPYLFRRLSNGKVTWKNDPALREAWSGPGLPAFAKADVWGALRRLQCPMLLVKGETGSHVDREICRQMVSYGRNSRWTEMPNTSHLLLKENLEGFLKEAESFLDQVDATNVA